MAVNPCHAVKRISAAESLSTGGHSRRNRAEMTIVGIVCIGASEPMRNRHRRAYRVEFSGSRAYHRSARRTACSIGYLAWFRQRINPFDREDILSDAEGNIAQPTEQRASEGSDRSAAAGVR